MRIVSILLTIFLFSIAKTHAAEPSVETIIKHYDIEGDSASELKRQMKRKGPKGYWGYNKWWIKWSGSCKVSVKITITMPRWKNRSKGSPSIERQWVKMYGLLKKHELNHSENGVGAAKEILAKDYRNPKKIIKKWNAKDKEYDRLTRHGVKEGIRL